jgi:hypothetical protein
MVLEVIPIEVGFFRQAFPIHSASGDSKTWQNELT